MQQPRVLDFAQFHYKTLCLNSIKYNITAVASFVTLLFEQY